MSDEKKKVLEMVEAGKITPEDAARLLEALGESPEAVPGGTEQASALISCPQEEIPTAPGEEHAQPEAGEAVLPLQGGTPYEYGQPAQEIKSVSISWVSGPVELRRGQGDQLRVTEYASRPLKPEEQLTLSLEDGELEIEWWGKASHKALFGPLTLQKHLVVELPQTVERLDSLELKNVSEGVYVEGLSADDLSISSVSGAVYATDLQGDDVTIRSVSGTVHAQNVLADDLSVSSVSGGVEAVSCGGGDVTVKSVSGRVRAGNITGDDVSAQTTSGSVDLLMGGMSGDIAMKSVSGKLCLTLPDDPQGFSVCYKTVSGKFSSEFPLQGYLDKKSGEGEYGGGKTDVNFTTTSGSMEIRRG